MSRSPNSISKQHEDFGEWLIAAVITIIVFAVAGYICSWLNPPQIFWLLPYVLAGYVYFKIRSLQKEDS